MQSQQPKADIFNPQLNDRQSTYWGGLHGCALALATAQLFKQHGKSILVIADNQRQAEQITSELEFFLNDASQVQHFADWECLPYDRFSPHPEIVSSRLAVLADLVNERVCIRVVTLANLMQRLPPIEYISGFSFKIKTGDKLELNAFRNRLQQAAYYAVSQVMAPGEYAIRGGILDIFPMGSPAPLRIDLFDDEIESLKYFEPSSQRSTQEIQSLALLPARDFPMHDDAVRLFRQNFRKAFAGDPKLQTVYNDVSNHHVSPGLEFYFPLFFQHTATLFHYIANETLIIQAEDLYQKAQIIFADIEDRFTNASLDLTRCVLPPDNLYLRPNQLAEHINHHQNIVIHYQRRRQSMVSFDTRTPAMLDVDPKSQRPYQKLIDHIQAGDKRFLIAAETAGRHEALTSIFSSESLNVCHVDNWQSFLNQPAKLSSTVAQIERGLSFNDLNLEVICETQLYGERTTTIRSASLKHDPESIIRSLAELKVGDPVVHENHGIGRYKGLKTMSLAGTTTEFMVIEYLDNAKLYVPVLSLHLINRYTTNSPESAPIHHLGSDQWEKIKQKAKQKAYDVAVELLEIQSIREVRKGFSFMIPQLELGLLEASFDYQETPEQHQAITEVLADMASEKPMDRLVCGDVGFGKTEVAIRAAFVAAHNNKQVAVLVPTTLLAQQHFETFKNRFAGHAIDIQLLSRFKSASQIKQTLEHVSKGQTDIVIGTHRLLQTDIDFNRLGLLILDEEHRFGVRQKERLKKLRHEVDILTLTATPIPRTLNQTLASMREISIISTPPKDRLSVQTFVRERNKGLIKEAIQRETRRGGQVYFLHNDVRTIPQQADELQALVPDITIGIGHGQMPEHQLETVMQNFYHRRFNVLICTTIVESGIDNPAANTIIINRADRFGLAQLHQLRGRVGRSSHQAFAYLLVDSFKTITTDAQKRLDAIASLKELGAGFALASHDLEIRGAGELLGEAQSGTIDQVGFSLYSQYLNQAVSSLSKTNRKTDLITQTNTTEIDIEFPALLPETFIPDVHMRLEFYKRIASIAGKEQLHELKIELADRFGFLPEEAKLLLELAALKPIAQQLGITRIHIGQNQGCFEFNDNPGFDPIKLINLIQQHHQLYQLQGQGRLIIKAKLAEKNERVDQINTVFNQLID